MKLKQKQQLPTETADGQKATMPMRSGKRSREVMLEEMEASLEEMKHKMVKMEEWKERTGKENRQLKRKLGQVERKLRQLQKKLERYKCRQPKKRKRCEKMEDSASRILQLQFKIQPSPRIFTNTKVKGDKSVALQLVLVDPLTGQVVSSGPESSMEVELVLVDGDFTGSETGNWTWKYFTKKIISRKRGQQPILIGEIVLKLSEGIAVVRNLKIADNSSWVPSRSFRLAARVTDGYFSGMRVKEAITNPFVVIEDRLKSIQKHYPPRLEDDVWRLEGIAKNGKYHQRLKEREIFKVQDFLKSLQENGNGLRDEILKMHPSRWEVTVKHAETCIPSGEMAPFCNQQIKPGWETSQPTEVVKQQSVQTVHEQHGVVGVSSNGRTRIQIDGCSNHQQSGGSSLLQYITSQPFAECLHTAVAGTSTSGYTLPFGSVASFSAGANSPPVYMNSCLNGFQENGQYVFGPEYYEIPGQASIFDYEIRYLLNPQESYHVGSADDCFNMPSESTAEKHKGNLKWWTLVTVKLFSKRMVALKRMHVGNHF